MWLPVMKSDRKKGLYTILSRITFKFNYGKTVLIPLYNKDYYQNIFDGQYLLGS